MAGISGIGFVGLSVTDVRRSADWYAELLELDQIRESVDDNGLIVEILLRDPEIGLELGLVAHRSNSGEPFSEFRTGLDHVEFTVEQREDLNDWTKRLDMLGIGHSGIKDLGDAAMVTFRDPDNIQLEFFWSRR